MSVYRYPKYYEVAFDFMNVKKQVDLFERFIGEYSRVRVGRVLDIGCGPGLQLREMARRGYQATGLDLSLRMLRYLEKESREEDLAIETVRADLTDFRLKKRADFAFMMMGTITYVKDNAGLLSHLDSVGSSLRKGGLYLIENMRLDWRAKDLFRPGVWTMRKGGVRVKVTYTTRLKSALSQMMTETLRLEVDDHGKRLTIEDVGETKLIFPQEFLQLVEVNGKFDFLGWFERERMRPLRKASNDNLTLLRRK